MATSRISAAMPTCCSSWSVVATSKKAQKIIQSKASALADEMNVEAMGGELAVAVRTGAGTTKPKVNHAGTVVT